MAATIAMVFVTVIGFGSLTVPVLKLLKITRLSADDWDAVQSGGLAPDVSRNCWLSIDKRLIAPRLIREECIPKHWKTPEAGAAVQGRAVVQAAALGGEGGVGVGGERSASSDDDALDGALGQSSGGGGAFAALQEPPPALGEAVADAYVVGGVGGGGGDSDEDLL